MVQDRPWAPFSLPILRIFLSRPSSVGRTRQARQMGRPSRRREVGFRQRKQRFWGSFRFTIGFFSELECTFRLLMNGAGRG